MNFHRTKFLICYFCCVFILSISCRKKSISQDLSGNTSRQDSFYALYTILPEPKPGDWLYEHREPGQSFDSYIENNPSVANAVRNKIYLVRLGDFDSSEFKIFNYTKEYLHAFFNLEVLDLPALKLSTIPSSFIRNGQLQTKYILDSLLKKKLPENAVGLMAIATSDLYPDEEWNFVFGEADARNRIGVASMARYGDPSANDSAFQLCMHRLINTATHEFCHMLSMYHCTTWYCVVNGSNSLGESDKKPMIPCPQCLEKLNYALDQNNVEFFKRMEIITEAYQFKENQFCVNALNVLK